MTHKPWIHKELIGQGFRYWCIIMGTFTSVASTMVIPSPKMYQDGFLRLLIRRYAVSVHFNLETATGALQNKNWSTQTRCWQVVLVMMRLIGHENTIWAQFKHDFHRTLSCYGHWLLCSALWWTLLFIQNWSADDFWHPSVYCAIVWK